MCVHERSIVLLKNVRIPLAGRIADATQFLAGVEKFPGVVCTMSELLHASGDTAGAARVVDAALAFWQSRTQSLTGDERQRSIRFAAQVPTQAVLRTHTAIN